jgi:hypothetical protein
MAVERSVSVRAGPTDYDRLQWMALFPKTPGGKKRALNAGSPAAFFAADLPLRASHPSASKPALQVDGF